MSTEEQQEHYYKEKTKIPLHLGEVSALIKDTELKLVSSPPVFSWRQIDKGSLIMAENMLIPEGQGKLLDMGCGYGVLGIFAALQNPLLEVQMVDSSERAVYLTKKNIRKYGLGSRVTVVQGNLFEKLEDKDFDTIVSNPPYSAGKDVVERLIADSPAYLAEGGTLQIVGRHSKGGKMYRDYIKEAFTYEFEFGKQSGFRIYLGSKKDIPELREDKESILESYSTDE